MRIEFASSQRRLCAGLISLALWVVSTAVAAAPMAGRSVAQVLRDAESSGIRIVFTDQSVPPELRVSAEPQASEPIAQLREILDAHGLALEEISRGAYVVTPKPHAQAPDLPVTTIHAITPVEQVQVTASRYTIDSLSTQQAFHAGHVELERQPALFNDVTRSIRRFPGTAGQDLSSRTFVRGGTPDDNLVMLDGVPLYEPFHLSRLPVNFSVIDPAVIDRVDFYSGVLPLEHGDRMGSQVDLHLREPGEELGGRVAIGMLDVSGLASGQLPADRGDWLMFARRGVFGRAVHLNDPDIGHPTLLDGLARVRYRLDDDSVLTIGMLGAQDHALVGGGSSLLIGFTVPYSAWTSFNADTSQRTYAWTAYEKNWDQLQSRTQLTYTAVRIGSNGYLFDVLDSSGSLADHRLLRAALLEQGWTLALDSGSTLRWGASLREEQAHFDFHRQINLDEDLASFYQRPLQTDDNIVTGAALHEQSAYLALNHPLSRWFTLEAGMRVSHARYSTGQGTTGHDPRVSLRFDLSPATRLRLSAGRMTQVWSAAELPVEQGRVAFDPLSRSKTAVASAEHEFGDFLSVRAEMYRKHISSPRPRRENIFYPTAFLPELRADEIVIGPEFARVSGVDLYATAQFSERFSGWFSYSRSYAADWINGVRIVRSWNQPDALGMGMTMDGRAWLLSAEVFAHTSWPLTPLLTSVITDGSNNLVGIVNSAGGLSSSQHGYFISLNLKAARTLRFQSGTLRLQAEVLNAENRLNVCCQEVSFTRFSEGGGAVGAMQNSHFWPYIMPYASVSWEF